MKSKKNAETIRILPNSDGNRFSGCVFASVSGGVGMVLDGIDNTFIEDSVFINTSTAVVATNVDGLTVLDCEELSLNRKGVGAANDVADMLKNRTWLSEESTQACLERIKEEKLNGNVRNKWWKKYRP